MLAYRAETRLAAALAPGLSRPETACALVKALLRTNASILPDPVAGTPTVRLLHQASQGQDAALPPCWRNSTRPARCTRVRTYAWCAKSFRTIPARRMGLPWASSSYRIGAKPRQTIWTACSEI